MKLYDQVKNTYDWQRRGRVVLPMNKVAMFRRQLRRAENGRFKTVFRISNRVIVEKV